MKNIFKSILGLFLSLIFVISANAAPQRYTNGVSNTNAGAALGQYLALDPTVAHEFFDEFYIYRTTDWTLTTTEAGGGSATEAVGDEDGGVILITNAAGNDDHDFFQTVDEVYLLESTKKAWFRSRFKVSDATESDFIVGLQIRDTTPLSVTDGVFFRKDDDDTNLDFIVQESATAITTTSAIATVSDNTYLTVGWYYDGRTTIHYFVNNIELGTVTTTNVLPSTELTVSWGIQNGEAVAKTMNMDNLFVSKER